MALGRRVLGLFDSRLDTGKSLDFHVIPSFPPAAIKAGRLERYLVGLNRNFPVFFWGALD